MPLSLAIDIHLMQKPQFFQIETRPKWKTEIKLDEIFTRFIKIVERLEKIKYINTLLLFLFDLLIKIHNFFV